MLIRSLDQASAGKSRLNSQLFEMDIPEPQFLPGLNPLKNTVNLKPAEYSLNTMARVVSGVSKLQPLAKV